MAKPVITLAAHFASFQQLALQGASPSDRQGARGIFYAGAAAMWIAIFEIWKADPNATGELLERMKDELDHFQAEALRRAGGG